MSEEEEEKARNHGSSISRENRWGISMFVEVVRCLIKGRRNDACIDRGERKNEGFHMRERDR